ncbi:MAG: DUF1732 domain-containing protein [Nannocystaceae bacterium]
MSLCSMTGYGESEMIWRDPREGDEQRVHVEIRTVNARYREIKFRHPFGAKIEHALRKRVERELGRGRVDVNIRCERAGPSAVDREGVDDASWVSARRALEQLQSALVETSLEVGPVSPVELLNFLASQRRPSEVPDIPIDALVGALDDALGRLCGMRSKEGAALTAELARIVDELDVVRSALAEAVADDSPRRFAALTAQVARVCQGCDVELESARVAQEVALLVSRADVTEELARISSHVSQVRSVLTQAPHTGQGKTLDFLGQELVREFTTAGSKVSDHRASGMVIAAKGIIEQFREQVHNAQ